MPHLGKAYYNRGLAYLALQDYDRAIADLDQSIERSAHWTASPTREPSDSEFDSLLSGSGEQLDAQSYAAPLPSAYYNRALAYAAKGDFQRTIADLERALELQPDWSEAEQVLILVRAAGSSDISAVLSRVPTAVARNSATDWASLSDAGTAVPSVELTVPIAAYPPPEVPSTPSPDRGPESCDGKPLYMWSSPGTYTYKVRSGSDAEEPIVEDKTGVQ